MRVREKLLLISLVPVIISEMVKIFRVTQQTIQE